MSFGVKYRSEYYDDFKSKLHRIDVEKEGYLSSIITLRTTSERFQLNYNESELIEPSEALFSFIVNKTDVGTYDADFFEAEHHTVKIKYYIGTESSLEIHWVGWLKPENTTREFLYPEVVYRVSTIDGLNELKELDYEGFYLSGKQTVLQIIKNALSFNEIDDLDFHIQCGIYEDELMTSDENLFEVLSLDNRRFYKEQDGELVPMKCFEVIEECIEPFYCRFRQSGGYWRIVNGQEYVAVNESIVQSTAEVYDYTTVAKIDSLGETGYGRVVTITDDDLKESKWELSKQQPLKRLRIKFENKNLGGNELSNGDFSAGTTGWNNGTAPADWYVFDGDSGGGEDYLNLSEPSGVGDPNEEKYIESDTFGLDIGEGNGYIEYILDLELDNINYNSGDYLTNPPYMYVQMIDPDGITRGGVNRIIIQEGRQVYTTLFPTQFSLDKTGNWKIRITYVPNSGADLNVIALRIYEVQVLQNATTGTTFDTVYINEPVIEAYDEEEIIIKFADSLQNTDVGAIFREDSLGANLTSSWSRFFAVSSSPDILAALLLYLPFDGDANDDSGYNHNTTVVGASLTTDRDANPNSAYEFVAVESDEITVDFNSVFNTNYVTVLCWVYLETGGVERGIVFRPGSFTLGVSSNDTVIFKWTYDSGIPAGEVTSSFFGEIPIQTWTHIAVSFNGNRVKIYINGVFEYSSIATNGILADNTNEIRIGEDFGSDFFNGKIDEVIVYGRVLSDQEVEDVYSNGPLTPESTDETEKLPLWQLLAQQYLNDRQDYFDFVSFDLFDLNNQIEFNSIIEYNSKYYRFVNYTKSFNRMLVSGDMVQVSTVDVPFSRTIQQLTSVDGKTTKESVGTASVIQQNIYQTIINQSGEEFSFTWADSSSGSESIGIPTDNLIVLRGLMIQGSVRCYVEVTVAHDGSTASANVSRTPATSATSIFRNIITGAAIDSVEISLNYTNNSGGSISFSGLLEKY